MRPDFSRTAVGIELTGKDAFDYVTVSVLRCLDRQILGSHQQIESSVAFSIGQQIVDFRLAQLCLHMVRPRAERGGDKVRVAEKTRDESADGLMEGLIGRSGLLNLAILHHGDDIPHGQGRLLIMRDKDNRYSCLMQYFPHLLLQPRAQVWIKVGERLVHQKDLGRRRQGASKGDSLALPA